MGVERNWIVTALIALGGAIAGWWVRLPDAVQILVYVMLADVLTGLTRAGMAGELNSHCSFRGMMKKAGMLIITALGVILDGEMRPTVHLGSMLAAAFTAVEGVSIIENCDAMGIPLPPVFRDLFRNPRKRSTKRKDENGKQDQTDKKEEKK